MSTPKYTFCPWSEAVVRQGEDGPYTAEIYTVACTDAQGHRWLYIGPAECPDAATAERHAALMQRVAATRPWWWPQPSMWAPGPTVYGSPAWTSADHADLEPELLAPTREAADRVAWDRDHAVAARNRSLGLR